MEEPTLETSDRWFAAYCWAKGVRLVRVNPGSWASWTFSDSDGAASRAWAAWYEAEAPVHARAYAEAYRAVRRLERSAS